VTDHAMASPRRLVVFLSALGRCASVGEAMEVGTSVASRELGAEIGVLIEGERVRVAAGFSREAAPVVALASAPLGAGMVDLPGLGVFHTLAAAWSGSQSGRLVLARGDVPFTSNDRDLLLGMAGGFGMAVASIRALEHGRAQLRTLEVLLSIQRSISRHLPLPTILVAVTDGASRVLGGCPVSLVLNNPYDPGHPVHVGALLAPGSTTFAAQVHVQGVPAGSLSATTVDGARVTDEHRALLSTFAEHASLALTDARTVEALHEAFHDALTGLPNRPRFLDTLTGALADQQESSVAVLFVDLDRFKAVNDTLGHAAGDVLLLAVADRLRAATSEVSTPARFGGDEFALLVIDEGGLGAAEQVARDLIGALAQPFVIKDKHVVVGATVGIAYGSEGCTAAELLADADLAMYRAKAAGGGRFATFDPQMREELTARLDLEAELSVALSRHELAVVFQPIVDLVTGEPVAVETLLRWNHPTRAFVSPLEVIPIAEANGLIVPIGRWVLGRAVRWIAQWRKTVPDLRITVNVSVHQLRAKGFVEEVNRTLVLAGVPPQALILEITESALIVDKDDTIDTLEALDALGVSIALDDFGTGYSSLSYLQRFPVHMLKIDRSFVSGDEEVKSTRLVRSIIELGRAYHIDVVAEGIEDESQMRALRAMGCRFGQGYYFERPTGPETVLGALDRLMPPPAEALEASGHVAGAGAN